MTVPLAFLGVIIIWSTTPLAIKWSGEGGGVLFGVTARMVIGASVCIALVSLLRKPLPLNRLAIQVYLAGSVAGYGSMLLVYWGASYIPSGWLSVLFGLTPIITAILSLIFLRTESFTSYHFLGMLVAVLGLWWMFSGDQSVTSVNKERGIGLVLLAVLLHAISTVWMQSLNSRINLPAISVTTGTLITIVPLYIITLLLTDFQWPQHIALRSSMSILYLGVIGSVVGFILFFYVLKHVSATRTGLITLITPVTALLLGSKLNNEQITTEVWLGTVMILSGLALFQWGQDLREALFGVHK